MQHLSSVWRLVDAANAAGAGLMLFDDGDRIIFSNDRNAKLFEFIDFDERPSYEDAFYACVTHNRFVEQDVYQNPERFLTSAIRFRRRHRFAQFMKEYPDGRMFLVTHEALPGIGSYFSRIDVTERMTGAARGHGALLGPDTWAGSAPVVPLALRSSLAALPAATAMVSSSGHLVDANAAMQVLLDRRDGLQLVNGRLVAELPAENDALQRLLADARGLKSDGAELVLRVTREGSEHPYLVLMSRCDMPRGLPQLAMLVVLDPEEQPNVPPSVLATLYDLTSAEARVAVALGRGEELTAIASRSGTSYQTVRVQLRSIFSKTGFRRQSDLVRLITRISTVFRPRLKE